jgi:outer membrane protein assembly factor BamD (BamD/ComL family)
MFRRRPLRRLLRQVGLQSGRSMLRSAHQFMAEGNYEEAQESFEALAKGAENNFPERAPFLYLQAGRAAILGGQTKKGMAHLRSGLTLFASQHRYHRLTALGQQAVDELTALGLTSEADEIREVIKNNLPGHVSAAVSVQKKNRPALPTHCPSCGAALKPNDVEWLDDVTTECEYCGSPVRGE